MALPLYPRLTIGQEFVRESDGHRFRVTDVGHRTFLAIDLTACEQSHPGDPSWLNGPPYAVPEMVWDESDFGALEGVAGIEWEEHGSGASLRRLLAAVRSFARPWEAQDGCRSQLLDDIVDAAKAYWGKLT